MPWCFGTSGSVRTSSSHHVARWPERRPDLLAVHDPVVAVAHRRRPQRREVGARVGLGEPLAPDVVAAQHRGEQTALLLLGAVRHDRRCDVRDAEHVDRPGCAGAVHLLGPHDLLHHARAAARRTPRATRSRRSRASASSRVPRLATDELRARRARCPSTGPARGRRRSGARRATHGTRRGTPRPRGDRRSPRTRMRRASRSAVDGTPQPGS